MKIMKLLALLLFIIAQNQYIFALKGPFSDILAPFRRITKYIEHGIYHGSSSGVVLRNYEYYWHWQKTGAKTPKENLKILSNEYKHFTELINSERKKIESPISDAKEKKQVFINIRGSTLRKNWISWAMFAQNVVNASKKVTKSNWFTHSFNGF